MAQSAVYRLNICFIFTATLYLSNIGKRLFWLSPFFPDCDSSPNQNNQRRCEQKVMWGQILWEKVKYVEKARHWKSLLEITQRFGDFFFSRTLPPNHIPMHCSGTVLWLAFRSKICKNREILEPSNVVHVHSCLKIVGIVVVFAARDKLLSNIGDDIEKGGVPRTRHNSKYVCLCDLVHFVCLFVCAFACFLFVFCLFTWFGAFSFFVCLHDLGHFFV